MVRCCVVGRIESYMIRKNFFKEYKLNNNKVLTKYLNETNRSKCMIMNLESLLLS